MPERINCIIGPNGVGKTNLLDSIYYLSFCKSCFNNIDTANINFDEKYFSIQGTYSKSNGDNDIFHCALSKDKKTLYCFLMDNPKGEVVVKGIKNKINNIRVVGSNQKLKFKLNGGAVWLGVPPVLIVDFPATQIDKNASVIAIELDSPLELYRGQGGAVEKN